MAVTYSIVVSGTPERTVLCWLDDMVGSEHVAAHAGSITIAVADQAAMVGVLNRLHALGLAITSVERTPANGAAAG